MERGNTTNGEPVKRCASPHHGKWNGTYWKHEQENHRITAESDSELPTEYRLERSIFSLPVLIPKEQRCLFCDAVVSVPYPFE